MLHAPHDGHGAVGDCPHCEAELRVPGGGAFAAGDPGAFVPVGKPLSRDEVAERTAATAPPAANADGPKVEVPEPAAAPARPDAPPLGGGEPAVELEFEEVDGDEDVPLVFADGDDAASPADGFADPAADRAALRRARRRGRGGNPVLGGLLALTVVGGAAGAGWLLYDRLGASGAVELSATALPAGAFEPAEFVPPPDADPAAVAVVQAGLPMRSPLLVATLSAAPDEDGRPVDPPRIRVTVEPGPAGRLVRVSLADRPEVAAWLEERRDLIGAKRLAFVKAREDFFRAVAAGGDVGEYREPVALNTVRGVLGWSVEAVAAGRVAPCCGEPEDGELLFCLPAGAAMFTLRGRDVPGEGVAFPHVYQVTVRSP